MSKKLKTALITGASAGIGAATAKQLASEGYQLILIARRSEHLSKLSEEIALKFDVPCHNITLDVRNRDAVAKAIETLPEEFKTINVLVNNAGLASGLSTIDEGNMDDWDVMIDTNIKGLLYVTRNVVGLMKHGEQSHIINIGSIAGKEVYANGNVYCATKHAVDALNKAMRLELSKYPIKVTAIHPGAIETEFSIVRFHGDTQRAKMVYEGFESLVAQDIADTISFVLSRPQHVNINELTIMPTAQPIASLIHRKSTS
jgi:3-hydroxy acid dehydrogenase/malonic semialdehyde reductase